MKKKSIIFLISWFLLSAIIVEAQIEVNTSGNIGFGVSDPIPKVEIEDHQYLMFNSTATNNSGILFYEVYGKYATSVQYGAFIEYAPYVDNLIIGTYQNGTKNNGLFFERDHGHVGIGSTNQSWGYELRVDDDLQVLDQLLVGGDAWVHGNEVVTSDLNVKSNISTIDGNEALNKLSQLKGRSYQYKNKDELETYYQSIGISLVSADAAEADSGSNCTSIDLPNFPTGTQYGLIAQEVNDIFPEAVIYNEEVKLYGVDYNSLIPILIEAIKEQQSIIENLQSEISSLKESYLKNLTASGEDKQIADQNILYQNSPNPFSENTYIRFFLSEKTKDAQIIIYDMRGVQLKSIPITGFGESSVEISSGDLSAGIYLYSMIADGELINTKQMVLTAK